ncbi:unnamed protein product [Moneuplotes crassus]|uniref:Uncharacterized protein n=1 Tax=Euplotes crassus TaxID=5936 RepID=A0AAD1UGG4_EUPCR|nr:unnamed protein product [Moneuplotes crassus]
MYDIFQAKTAEKASLFQNNRILPVPYKEISLQNFCSCNCQKIHGFFQNYEMNTNEKYCITGEDSLKKPVIEQKASKLPPLLTSNLNRHESSGSLDSLVDSQTEHLPSSQIQNLSRRQMKMIERNFTNSSARKDVIYKAILRFFRRACQFGVKQIECRYDGYEQINQVSCHHLEEKSSVFLQEVLGLTVTPELEEIFSIIISFNPDKTNLARSSYIFSSLFTGSITKFNRKKLQKLFENKLFARVFLAFWKNTERFSEMVLSLNSKRDEEINQRAFKYYLDRLCHACNQTLGE